ISMLTLTANLIALFYNGSCGACGFLYSKRSFFFFFFLFYIYIYIYIYIYKIHSRSFCKGVC
ncbi:hypothetical protein K7X86_00855, partial [Candidatus Sulcia muelleri]|nr:hypothetical protein [Candidatus Karelsulcia muelleri]